jgi:hypothetical protein
MPARLIPRRAFFDGNMNNHVSAVIIFLVICCPGIAGAELKVLDGEHTVIYDIVNPRGVAFIPDYSNESFEQKVISQDEFSKRVRVTSKMHPISCSCRGHTTDRLAVPCAGTRPTIQ